MNSSTRDNAEAEGPESMVPPIPGVVSGMRPTARRAVGLGPGIETRLLSGPALAAVLAWLAALTMIAVDSMNADFVVAIVIAAIQAALIVAFFMRLGWDSKLHLLLVGVAALLVMLLLMAISADRSEYQPDLEHWGSSVRGHAWS